MTKLKDRVHFIIVMDPSTKAHGIRMRSKVLGRSNG